MYYKFSDILGYIKTKGLKAFNKNHLKKLEVYYNEIQFLFITHSFIKLVLFHLYYIKQAYMAIFKFFLFCHTQIFKLKVFKQLI